MIPHRGSRVVAPPPKYTGGFWRLTRRRGTQNLPYGRFGVPSAPRRSRFKQGVDCKLLGRAGGQAGRSVRRPFRGIEEVGVKLLPLRRLKRQRPLLLAKPGTDPAGTRGWGLLSGEGVTSELLPHGRGQRTAGVSPEYTVRLMTGALDGSRRDSTGGAESGARESAIRRGE